MKQLSYRLGNLELRTANFHLSKSKDPITMEIVQWNDEGLCLTIAYWRGDFDLIFVVDRPFHKSVDKLDFFELAETGQKHLVKGITGESV